MQEMKNFRNIGETKKSQKCACFPIRFNAKYYFMAVIYLGSSSNKNIKQLSLLKFCVGLKIETNLCCNVAQLNCTVLLPQYILCISICYNLPI